MDDPRRPEREGEPARHEERFDPGDRSYGWRQEPGYGSQGVWPGHLSGAEDDRIREDVIRLLRHDPALASALLEVTVRNGTVGLRGAVPDRAAALRAEELARSVPGVRELLSGL